MRTIPAGLAAVLDDETLTLCTIVKVERLDGVSLGFSSHDADLEVEGFLYEAASSLTASALRSTAEAGVDNLDLAGALDSDRITEEDLRNGVYDGAAVTISLVDWSAAGGSSAATALIAKGTIGRVEAGGWGFTAEFRSQSQRLSQLVGEVTSETCRARLGDSRCKKSLTAWRWTGTVYAIEDGRRLTVAGVSQATAMFDHGLLEATGGALAGTSWDVYKSRLVSGRTEVDLWEEMYSGLEVGDAVRLTAGCNRTFSQCMAKFANAPNFRGEPHVPGLKKMFERGRGQ